MSLPLHRIAFQQAVLRGWWTYADMLAAWEASDLQQTMLSASKQTAKVSQRAALLATLLATQPSSTRSSHHVLFCPLLYSSLRNSVCPSLSLSPSLLSSPLPPSLPPSLPPFLPPSQVACGGAALTVVCLATLLATSQSLHVAREVPTNSPAHLTPATRPFDPLDLTTSPFLDHHLLSETQMTGLFPPPLPAFLSPCDTSPNGTDQRDYLSRISVLKNRSALHEQFTAINFLVLAPHANRFRGSHSPLHPDYYQSRQARRRGYLRSKHGFLSTSVRVDPTGHEDRVHSSVGEPDPAQLHSSVGEPDPAQLHSLVGEPDPAQLHSVKSSSRINLCSCCLDRKGISKTAAADMPDVDNSTCRAAVSDIHHKPVVRASEPEISKEEWQESNNSWSETGTALHGILGMSDITLGEQDRRFVDVVGADLGAGCSYREPASTSIPLPPPLSSLPPSSLQPSNTALNASEGLFNYVIFSLLA